MLFLLWNAYNADPNNPIAHMWSRIRILLFTTCCIFVPAYAFIERDGMGNGILLDSLANTLYFVQVVVFTIGFGDFSPKTPLGKLVFCLYAAHAVYMGAGILSAAADVRDHYNKLKKYGRIMTRKLQDHIIIFVHTNDYTNNVEPLKQMIAEFHTHPLYDNPEILLIDTGNDPEMHVHLSDIADTSIASCHHVHSPLDGEEIFSNEFLGSISILECKACIILQQHTDAATIQLADRITKIVGFDSSKLHCEIQSEYSRSLAYDIGVGGVYRPNRHYPEFIACAVVAPGADNFLTEIVSSSACTIYSFPYQPTNQTNWTHVRTELMRVGFDGIPVAYHTSAGTTTVNPHRLDPLYDIKAVVCLVNSDRASYDDLNRVFNTIK